jgi:hypothetical protein
MKIAGGAGEVGVIRCVTKFGMMYLHNNLDKEGIYRNTANQSLKLKLDRENYKS